MQKNNTVTAIVGYCTRGVLVLLLLLFIGTGCVPVKNMTKVPPLEHAIYLAHRWVEEPWTEDEVEKLAQELQQANITTVYLHTGPFLQNGTVPKERYARADEFITLLRTLAPEVTVQAWLGQREARGGGILDLTSESTRKNIVETVGVVLENAPYDGIHLNIEPVITEDDSFTQTLQAVKESIGDKTLSTAIIPVEPVKGIHGLSTIWRPGDGMFLTPTEFQAIAAHVDEVMVMSYDTGLEEPLFYTTFVAMATQRMAQLDVNGPRVFMGVPTYEDERSNFHADTENIRTGTLGVLQGLRDANMGHNIQGIGLYAHWTTDQEEWKEFIDLIEENQYEQ